MKAPFPFESMSLFQPVSAADHDGKKAIYADPEFRAAFRERGFRGSLAQGWENAVVSSHPPDPSRREKLFISNGALVSLESHLVVDFWDQNMRYWK